MAIIYKDIFVSKSGIKISDPDPKICLKYNQKPKLVLERENFYTWLIGGSVLTFYIWTVNFLLFFNIKVFHHATLFFERTGYQICRMFGYCEKPDSRYPAGYKFFPIFIQY